MDLKPKLPSARSLFSSPSNQFEAKKSPPKPSQTTNAYLPWTNRAPRSHQQWQRQWQSKATANRNGNFQRVDDDFVDERDAVDEYQNQLMNFLKFKEDLKLIQYKGKTISLETPEDIAKWREERRANYPSAKNVEAKKNESKMNQRQPKRGWQAKTKTGDHHNVAKNNEQDKSSNRFTNHWKNKRKLQFQRNEKPDQKSKRRLTLFQKLILNDLERNEDKIVDCLKLISDNFFKAPSGTTSHQDDKN